MEPNLYAKSTGDNSHLTTKEKSVEEIVREFEDKFFKYLQEVEVGQYDSNGKNIGFKTAKKLVDDWLRNTLQTERKKRDEVDSELRGKIANLV